MPERIAGCISWTCVYNPIQLWDTNRAYHGRNFQIIRTRKIKKNLTAKAYKRVIPLNNVLIFGSKIRL